MILFGYVLKLGMPFFVALSLLTIFRKKNKCDERSPADSEGSKWENTVENKLLHPQLCLLVYKP